MSIFINIAGEELTAQELRNAIYTGSWLADARQKFSKPNCVGYLKGQKYIKGNPIKQVYLETALKWISERDNCSIEQYMSAHQHDSDASELWLYFQNVINWVEILFKYDKDTMIDQDWGFYYNKYNQNKYDTTKIKARVEELMGDYDVSKKRGIYEFVLSGEAPEKRRLLSIRAFDDPTKKAVYKEQKGRCKACGKDCTYKEMQADHITPWHLGGHTVRENCQMLCADCNRRKSGK